MKIVILSDTHGDFNRLLNVVELNYDADLILHLGDGASEFFKVKQMVKNIPMVMVKGNCDSPGYNLEKEKTFNFNGISLYACHGDFFDVKNGLEKYIEFAKKFKFNIIAYGHTHKRLIQKTKDLFILNPGSLTLPRSYSASYLILTIKNKEYDAEIVEYIWILKL